MKTNSQGSGVSQNLSGKMSDMSLGGKDKNGRKEENGSGKKKGLFGKMKW